jgi:hypothetical protein
MQDLGVDKQKDALFRPAYWSTVEGARASGKPVSSADGPRLQSGAVVHLHLQLWVFV